MKLKNNDGLTIMVMIIVMIIEIDKYVDNDCDDLFKKYNDDIDYLADPLLVFPFLAPWLSFSASAFSPQLLFSIDHLQGSHWP